ncbi:NUDIX hydrolase [Streptomyces sp. NPDC005236]|uniref:NUDIX hydrolase n=1 Tax=Streptomyces sp. NPDC005236 TaxID=3157028 RepID=UPI0033A6C253
MNTESRDMSGAGSSHTPGLNPVTQGMPRVGPFFHGGVPGLVPGDKILPPSVTGSPRTTKTSGAAASYLRFVRDDLAYFSSALWLAAFHATAYPDGGLYEVQLHGEITPDPHTPGNGWCARSATVVRVVEPVVEMRRDLTTEQIIDQCGDSAPLTNRMISFLQSERPHEVACWRGHTHWGQFNAAGLLLRQAGDEPRYLLRQRAAGTRHAGTWGLPGGALRWEEPPYTGALREATEELGALPALKPRVIGIDDHGGWKYFTAVVDVAAPFALPGGDGDGVAYRWCTEGELLGLRLHPGLAERWPQLGGLLARY